MSCSHGDFSFKDQKPYRVDPKVFSLIEEGDILLRQGLGPFSTYIVRGLDDKHKFSHCGIACKVKGKLTIVHSISPDMSGIDGLQTQDFKDFFGDVADSNIAIIRPKLDSAQKARFLASALLYLDKKIVFDHHFNYQDDSQIYCSELVYLCYLNATGKNPFLFKKSGKVDIMRFDSFYQPEYFTLIWEARQDKPDSYRTGKKIEP